MGEDANMVNDEGYAPLHLMVTRQYGNRMDLIVALMTYSYADINVTTTKEGRSALHLAVEVRGERTKGDLGLNCTVNSALGFP